MAKTFEWARGYRKSHLADAADVRKELEELRKKSGGVLDPEVVVKAAKKRRSAMNPIIFECDDQEAALQFRITEARTMIRCLRVVVEDHKGDDPKRFYVHVETEEESGYVTTSQVQTKEEYYTSLLEQAKRELESFRERYRELSELKPLFRVIDKL